MFHTSLRLVFRMLSHVFLHCNIISWLCRPKCFSQPVIKTHIHSDLQSHAFCHTYMCHTPSPLMLCLWPTYPNKCSVYVLICVCSMVSALRSYSAQMILFKIILRKKILLHQLHMFEHGPSHIYLQMSNTEVHIHFANASHMADICISDVRCIFLTC